MPDNPKKLQKLLTFSDDPGLAIFDELDELNENLNDLSKILKFADFSEIEALKGEQGEQGIQGEPGENGLDGLNGKDGKDGKNGKDGLDGLDGDDGKPGKDGRDGKDGSPDTGLQIKEKLSLLKGDERLDASAIKGLPKFDRLGRDGYPRGLPQPAGALTYRLNGAQVGRGNILNLQEGSNITITPVSTGNDDLTYIIEASGPGITVDIGDTIGGGTDPSVLFIQGGLLAQDPTNFGYDPAVEFYVDIGDLSIVNNLTGYTPVGPLPFAGATLLTAFTPYDGYIGMLSAGGAPRAIMHVLDGAGRQGRLATEIGQITLEADLDINNTTQIDMIPGGSPVIQITANSNANQTVATFDPTTQTTSLGATDGTGTANLSLDGGNYLAQLSSGDGTGPTTAFTLDGATPSGSIIIDDGVTNLTSLTLDASVAPSATVSTTDGTGTVSMSLLGSSYQASINANDGGSSSSSILVEGDASPRVVIDSTDGTGDVSTNYNGLTYTITDTATDGAAVSSITVDGSATPFINASSNDGVGTATALVDGTNYNVQLSSDDGATNAANLSVDGSSPLVFANATDGTRSVTLAMDGDATPNITTNVNNGAGQDSTFTQTPTGFAMTDDLTVPDEVYSSGWDGSLEVPTKNAIYDAIQANIYSPVASNTANLDATPSVTGRYMRIGNTVMVSGSFLANPTAAGNTSFEVTLPFASNFSTSDQATGSFTINGAIAVWEGGSINAAPANDRLNFNWQATNTAGQTYYWEAMYQII